MSYDHTLTAGALVDIIKAATDDTPAVFAQPPRTFNPPAVIVRMPESVEPAAVGMTVDRAMVPLLCAVGADQMPELMGLLGQVRKAVLAQRSLGGIAQATWPASYRNFALITVAGADYLSAEVLLEIHA